MNVFQMYKSAREYLTPVLQDSMFLDRGMLTPEEFVRAGDQLIRTCPNWQWQAGESTKLRAYLPPDKQFLTTRGVPSFRRVSQMQAATDIEHDVEVIDGRENWCAPEMRPMDSINGLADDFDAVLIDASDITDPDAQLNNKTRDPIEKSTTGSLDTTTTFSNSNAISNKLGNDIEDEYADMEEESLALDDSAATVAKSVQTVESKFATKESAIIKVRRYDVSITYDNYYRTPRIWLFGYNENGSPLSANEIFQDVMQDYAKKTVTVDPHPHLANPHASIHPCQHAAAMLKIIQALQECGRIPTVDQYMFIFLKFIQSVVPTIEYDYTIDVQAR